MPVLNSSTRLRNLRISAESLVMGWRAPNKRLLEITAHPLPPDTRVVSVRVAPGGRDLIFTLTSETFEELPVGARIVDLPPIHFRQSFLTKRFASSRELT